MSVFVVVMHTSAIVFTWVHEGFCFALNSLTFVLSSHFNAAKTVHPSILKMDLGGWRFCLSIRASNIDQSCSREYFLLVLDYLHQCGEFGKGLH